MNHIVLNVMRDIDNPKLTTLKQKSYNGENSVIKLKSCCSPFYGYSNSKEEKIAHAAYDLCHAAYQQAEKHKFADFEYVNYYVNKYFEISGENKNDYLNKVERLKND